MTAEADEFPLVAWDAEDVRYLHVHEPARGATASRMSQCNRQLPAASSSMQWDARDGNTKRILPTKPLQLVACMYCRY